MNEHLTIKSIESRCNNILECVLNLNHQEIISYKALVQNGPMKIEELGLKIARNRSTASRCLKRLESCGICQKRKIVVERGGYYFLYEALPPEKVKQILKECTNKWYEDKKRAIDSFLE